MKEGREDGSENGRRRGEISFYSKVGWGPMFMNEDETAFDGLPKWLKQQSPQKGRHSLMLCTICISIFITTRN